MTKEELDAEIEYIHSNRSSKKLLRPFDVMFDAIIEVTNTYTNLSLFMNDYMHLYRDNKINENIYNSAINDLYLLALVHSTCEEDLEDE